MQSIQTEYLAELIQAHREALKVLRELLADETDPAERRRLAIAILRARPVKEPKPTPAAAPHAAEDPRNHARADEETTRPAPPKARASTPRPTITDAEFDTMLAEALAELTAAHPIDPVRQAAAHLAGEHDPQPE